MAEREIPEAWIGRRVEALIVRGWSSSMGTDRALTAWVETGVLDGVNDRGIVATFEEEDEPSVRALYPWGAVLRLRPV